MKPKETKPYHNIWSHKGVYHDTIQIKEKLYDIEGGDDYFETKGTYLPFAHVNDYTSYFTSTPTETLQTILREAELTDIKISCFLILETRSVNAGPYSATCYRITEEGASEYEYDFRKEDLGNDLDAIFNTLLAKHEVING